MNILVTGGAGFIGSNLVEALLQDPRVSKVRVLDDLSTGLRVNVDRYMAHPKYEFIQGDICDFEVCQRAMKDIHRVSHQAALGSVPRSIADPIRTNDVNIGGTVHIFKAAIDAGVDRVVLACSSSTYGDSPSLPKVEEKIGNPLSPYAVTKAAIEQYAKVFATNYPIDYIGLRYFNVFGRYQSPDNPYAAVIPLFCKSFLYKKPPTINGDGLTSRDFTYIDNAVQANILSLFTDNPAAINQIYNIAFGEANTLIELVRSLQEITNEQISPIHGPERPGDIKHSLADIQKAKKLLKYDPLVNFHEGLKRVFTWYQAQYADS
jgi:UDP-N-acetylglucosamine 4-epimerase